MPSTVDDDVTPDPSPPGRRSGPRSAGPILLLVLLLAVVGGLLSRGTSAPQPATAPDEVFSAERAAAAAAPLVQEPRPAGTEANAAAHDHLAEQLAAAEFEVTSTEGIGRRAAEGTGSAGYVRNLVATRPGSDPTGTLVLATHIDSVPHAPGAADAGVGLAVILETVRALGPEALRNDLVVLLVDGEETGLLGAQAYVDGAGAELRAPVVVLNHEARGISGRPLVARTAGPMHETLPAMPRPEYESFTDALFGVIPNDTDFTVYRDEAGWWGLDVALIGEAWAYHSPQDDAEHLDPGSLQHFGELTLSLTRELGAQDLAALEPATGDRPVQTTMPWGILVMPPWLVQGLGLAAPLALAATAAVLRRRGRLTLLGSSFGVLLALLAIALAGAAGYWLWSATAAASPDILSQTMKEPVVALPFLGAELLAGAAVMAGAWVLGRLLVGRDALLAGTGMLALLLIAAVAVLSPAFASSMVLPAAAAGIGILLGTLLPPVPSLVVRAAALLPTGWLVGTQVHALGEFGIASSAGALAATTALALAAAAPLLIAPQGEASGAARRPHRLLIPVLPAVFTVGLAIGGTALTRAAGEPVQERVLAAVDAETGQTRWESDGVTEWGRSLDGTEGTSVVEGPQVEVEPAGEGTTSTRIRLTSARPGAEYRLELTEGEFSGVTIDGEPLSDDGSAGAQGLHVLRILGVPAGHEVVIEAEVPDGASMEVIETVYSPALADGWVAPGSGVSLVQPRVEISRTVTL